MKQLVAGIAFCGLLFAGCSDKESLESQRNQLPGTWMLKSSTGGNVKAPAGLQPPSNGLSSHYTFTMTDYELFAADTIIKGKYTVVQDKYAGNGKLMNKLIFDGNPDSNSYLEISGNTLTIYSGTIAADGTISTWERFH